MFSISKRSVNNMLGPRWTLLLGSAGYPLYIGSFLWVLTNRESIYLRNTQTIIRAINIHPKAGGFVIGAGAILGLCAGLLWTAQGSLMLSYPTESQKGLFISVFWAIFNLGAVVGASVSLGQNYQSQVRDAGLHVRMLILIMYIMIG